MLARLPVASHEALLELPACRIRTLKVGHLSALASGSRTGVTIPILAYLLEAPGGLFAVDCGLSGRWADAGEVHLGPEDSPSPGIPYLPELHGPTMGSQLATMGLRPDRLVCTHLHEDHAGGAAELSLTLEASEAELGRLAQPDAADLGYPVDELAGVATKEIQLDATRPLGPFPASAELAAGVLAVDTSGHTPGSISVLACIGSAYALVCGDAVYPWLDQPRSPAFVGALRIRRAMEAIHGLRLFPAHDTVVLRSGAADDWLGPSPPGE